MTQRSASRHRYRSRLIGSSPLGRGQGGNVGATTAGTGWWVVPEKTTVAAYQAKGAANLAGSYANLANPGTYTLTPFSGSAPTWSSATGWTFDGTEEHLRSGVVPADGWSGFVRFANLAGASPQVAFGSFTDGSTRFTMQLRPPAENDQLVYQSGSSVLSVAPAITSGVVGMAGTVAYRNGVAESGTIGASWGTSTRDIYIGAVNNNGVVTTFYGGDIIAVVFFSDILTADEVASLTTRMQAL